MRQRSSAVTAWYLTLLIVQAAHVCEEVWGRFWLVKAYGLKWFLVVNGVLFAIPTLIFVGIVRGHGWAYRLGQGYAVVMVANGSGHTLGTLLSRRYRDGFAGGGSGLAAAIIGVGLFRRLRTARSGRRHPAGGSAGRAPTTSHRP